MRTQDIGVLFGELRQTLVELMKLVNFYLDQEGWVVTNVEFSAWIQAEQYKPENEGYKYALEAEKAGSSFLIQTYQADNRK